MEEKGIARVEFTPAVITADFDEMRERLDEWMEPYRDMDDAALAQMERKELADLRGDVNKLIKSMEDGRKAVKRDYMKAYDAFEQQVKGLLEPAKAASAQLKAQIDRKDELKRMERENGLREYYAEVAGILADHIGFESVFDPEWVKSEAKYKAAFDQLFDKCRKLQSDHKALRKMGGLFDPAEVERDLFRTFDLSGALERDAERRAESERLAALKEEMGVPQAWDERPVVVQEVKKPEVVPEAQEVLRIVVHIPATDAEAEATRAEIDELKRVMQRFGIHGGIEVKGVRNG